MINLTLLIFCKTLCWKVFFCFLVMTSAFRSCWIVPIILSFSKSWNCSKFCSWSRTIKLILCLYWETLWILLIGFLTMICIFSYLNWGIIPWWSCPINPTVKSWRWILHSVVVCLLATKCSFSYCMHIITLGLWPHVPN